MASSEYNQAQARYETEVRNANASDSDRQSRRRQEIEDNLVAGGEAACTDYEQMIKHNRQKANCIAEYEGVWMAQAILDRARKRLD